jgi:hypothetical protein
LAGEYAEGAMPVYYSELYREWRDLPEEFSNQFHNMITDLPDRIEDLMHADLYLYYYNEYSGAIVDLVREQEEQQVHYVSAEEIFG